MPRQTKDLVELEEKNKKKTVAKTATKKANTTKKSAVKKDVKKTVSKKTSKKADTEVGATKKTVSKKDAKNAVTKKVTKKVSTTKKSATTKRISSKSVKNEIIEYYDLPYRYNKTIVKILAQTPKKLFVYWDISDNDRKNFIKTYGDNFFEITKPVLIIRNTTMGYSFEVDIDDFANSWYLNINDSDCKYSIELGRRPKEYTHNINSDYIYVSSSNNIEAPNDHILFENEQNMVYFRNVKTNVMTAKDITSFSFLTNMGRIYNIYDLYKKIYADEELDEINNPSSSFMK
ncbi:MAG: DUF4912 domain-containing protein [Clostridia bacterium]|nr:DUF4912 domain-containing protein [Clostridia bacterium]